MLHPYEREEPSQNLGRATRKEDFSLKFISLLTDFGTRDGYAGILKGVIYTIAPDAQVADLSHNIHPQNIQEGALVWLRSYAFFPRGTVHVAVVDPGVGTRRRPIAARRNLPSLQLCFRRAPQCRRPFPRARGILQPLARVPRRLCGPYHALSARPGA